MRQRLALTVCLALACAGCSWLIGVSEDPVVPDVADGATPVGDASAVDATDAAADADEGGDDAEADAPVDAEEDV